MTRDAVALKEPDIDEFKHLESASFADFQPRFDQVRATSDSDRTEERYEHDQAPKTSADERFSAEAWGKAMWEGFVDKGVKEPVRGILTIPGIHEAVTSVFGEHAIPHVDHPSQKTAGERVAYAAGGALGELLPVGLSLIAAKPLMHSLQFSELRLGANIGLMGDSLRNFGTARGIGLISETGNKLEQVGRAMVYPELMAWAQRPISEFALGGGIHGFLFAPGAQEHSGFVDRLKSAGMSAASIAIERRFTDHLAEKLGGSPMRTMWVDSGKMYGAERSQMAFGGLVGAFMGALSSTTEAILEGHEPNPATAAGAILGHAGTGVLMSAIAEKRLISGIYHARHLMGIHGPVGPKFGHFLTAYSY